MNDRLVGPVLLALLMFTVCLVSSPPAWGQQCIGMECLGEGRGFGEEGTDPGLDRSSNGGDPYGTSNPAIGGGGGGVPSVYTPAIIAQMEAGAKAAAEAGPRGAVDGWQTGATIPIEWYAAGVCFSIRDAVVPSLTSWSSPPSAQGPDAFRWQGPPGPDPSSDFASKQAKADPVALRTGEFVHHSVDLEVLGGQIPFGIVRSYRSRMQFDGPLGPSWDHGLNARLFFNTNPAVCTTELTISLGDLAPVRMRPNATPAEGVVFYPVGTGNRWKMLHQATAACPWRLTSPTGVVYCFDGDGFAQSIQALNNERVELVWDSYQPDATHPQVTTKRLSRAERVLAGHATHQIRLQYGNAMKPGQLTQADLVAMAGTETVLDSVSYHYDAQSRLDTASDGSRLREQYGYGSQGVDSSRVVPLVGLEAYCDAACSYAAPNRCGQSFCEQVEAHITEKKECHDICWGKLCWDACFAESDTLLGTNPSAAKTSWNVNCAARCQDRCEIRCQTPAVIRNACQSSCKDNCMGMADEPAKYVYGQPRDLANNIETITDGAGRTFVRNHYGKDPVAPSFDAVTEQFMGNDDPVPMQFFYQDFAPPSLPKSAITTPAPYSESDPHAPDGTLRICSLSSLDFLDDIENARYPQPKPNPFDWSAPESPNDRINPADVTRLDVLTPQRLALRAAHLPQSAILKIGSTLTPIVLNSARLYESARPISHLSAGEILSVRTRDDILEVIATVASPASPPPPPAQMSQLSPECSSAEIQYESIAREIRPLSRATSSTRVMRSDGTSMVAYYNGSGDLIRLHDIDRRFYDEFEWDEDHNLLGKVRFAEYPVNGSIQPLTPRVCSTYNDRGLPTTVSQYPIDAPLNPSKQCFAWDTRGPWPTAATAPNDSNTLLFERRYDDAGRILTVKTEDKDAVSYAYDSLGHLTQITKQDGTITTFSNFDPLSAQPLTIIEDALGFKRTTSFTYDAFGHATSIDRHGWGPNENWKWEDRVCMTSRTVSGSAGSCSEQYLYTKSGLLQEVRGRTTTQFEYNDAGWPIRKVEFNPADPNDQRITCMHRRQDGSLWGYVDPMGVLWFEARSYEGSNFKTDLYARANVDPACALPTNTQGDPLPADPLIVEYRDGADHITARHDLEGRLKTFAYDGFGRLVSQADEVKTTSHFFYDARHRQVATLVNRGAPLPASIALASDPSHLTDLPDLFSATFLTYGPDGQPSRRQTYAYAIGNGLEPVSDELYQRNLATRSSTRTVNTATNSAVWTTKWDALGRLTAQTTSLGHSLTATYPSAMTRVLSLLGPEGNPIITTEKLDDFGSVLEQLDSKSKLLTKRVVDAFGRTTSELTGQSQLNLSYDPWSHVTSAVQTIASDSTKILSSKTYHFDPRGRLDSVDLGGVPTVSFTYDLLGRVVRESRSGRDTISHYLNTSSNPSSQTLPSGRVLAYEYNDPRKLLTAITADASKAKNVVGPLQQRAEFSYDALGLVQTATLSGSGLNPSTTSQQYDGVGRLRLDSAASVPSTRLDYGLGLGVTRQTIGEQSFDFNRYPDNRIQSIVSQASGSVVAYTFKGSGPAKQVIYGNGSVETRSFDDRGRILRQDLGSALDLTNEYDASGNTTLAQMVVASYHDKLNLYPDEAGRVASEILETSASAHHIAYNIDPANNWKSIERDGELLNTAPDVFHAYAATPSGSATYDADGRQLSAGQTSFAYDAFGRLARVQNANTNSSCSYEYDALGRRVRELCDGRETFFGYSGYNLVVEQSQGGAIATLHAGLSSPVLRVSLSAPNQKTYFVTGKDGSVRAALSQSGDVIESYAYTAFGDTTVTQKPGQQPTGNRFRFQGHYFDPIAGLYQMRARYYAPIWGRFLTPDPMGVVATGNPYAFVNNRPADLWDPFGLSPVANPYGQSFRNRRLPDGGWILDDNPNASQPSSNPSSTQQGYDFTQDGAFEKPFINGLVSSMVEPFSLLMKATGPDAPDIDLRPFKGVPRELEIFGQIATMPLFAGIGEISLATKALPVVDSSLTGGAELAAQLQARAAALNATRSVWLSQNGTTAMMLARNATSGELGTFVATEAIGAEPALASALRAGETFVSGVGHAEATILRSLGSDWTVLAGGSSRNICIGTCSPLLEQAGVQLGGPLFRGMSDKTPFRMFWK